jgi:hypothetical protein
MCREERDGVSDACGRFIPDAKVRGRNGILLSPGYSIAWQTTIDIIRGETSVPTRCHRAEAVQVEDAPKHPPSLFSLGPTLWGRQGDIGLRKGGSINFIVLDCQLQVLDDSGQGADE